jgi:hypothetical protein
VEPQPWSPSVGLGTYAGPALAAMPAVAPPSELPPQAAGDPWPATAGCFPLAPAPGLSLPPCGGPAGELAGPCFGLCPLQPAAAAWAPQPQPAWAQPQGQPAAAWPCAPQPAAPWSEAPGAELSDSDLEAILDAMLGAGGGPPVAYC